LGVEGGKDAERQRGKVERRERGRVWRRGRRSAWRQQGEDRSGGEERGRGTTSQRTGFAIFFTLPTRAKSVNPERCRPSSTLSTATFVDAAMRTCVPHRTMVSDVPPQRHRCSSSRPVACRARETLCSQTARPAARGMPRASATSHFLRINQSMKQPVMHSACDGPHGSAHSYQRRRAPA
jgi:hypothetical protein